MEADVVVGGHSIVDSGFHLRFTRFLLSLAVTTILVEFGGQVLSAGMARLPNATEILAVYGLA